MSNQGINIHPRLRLQVYNYLNELRESGDINMFGARPYVADEFEVDKKTAGDLLSMWMEGSLYNNKGE